MATVNVRHSDILVDRRLLAINFDELNLLQSSMLLPKPVNILALKKRFGIKLSKQDLIQDIQDKNSIIHKYFHSMIMAQIARVIWAQEEHTRQVLEIIEKKQKEEAVEFWIDEMRQEAIRDLLLKPHDELAANLPPNILISMTQAYELRYFIVQQAKYQDLGFYSQFAKTTKELQKIQDIIEKRYAIIEDTLRTLDRLEELASTPEEIEKVKELKERSARHLELSSYENMQKNININLNDSIVLGQHLNKLALNDELILEEFKSSEKQFKNKIQLELDPLLEEKFLRGNSNQVQTQNELNHWDYHVFQNDFNDALQKFIEDDKKLFTHGFQEVIALQAMLHKFLYKKNSIKSSQIEEQVLLLSNVLKNSKEIDYSKIIKCLDKWLEKRAKKEEIELSNQHVIHQNESQSELQKKPSLVSENEKEIYKNLLEKIQHLATNHDNSDKTTLILQEFYKALILGVEEGKHNLITTSFNKLVDEAPAFSAIGEIYIDLVSLSFAEIDKLKVPTPVMDYGF